MTDLQARLDLVGARAEQLLEEFRAQDGVIGQTRMSIAVCELAQLVAYLAALLSKHLETGEN